ncbi:DUF2290 domain-containing protein [Luteimonas sp. SX5]|uniref:DUF2290 domain-containing protein n=1 Tax=Luteimonas galliterrae TaxID=2940486 RepID=A0ABT0MGB0_9GAMM|nr:DUF2290 domain-containing protein [Luteimonas galliterrae]MCL1633355.1 DUF2290 domain-containing protein [Luteimonas galliterrae]
MITSDVAIRQSLARIKENLLEADLLYDWNEAVVERAAHGRRRVTWATDGTRPVLSVHQNASIEEYLGFLEGRHYNFLANDGAIFQFSYDLRRDGSVESSRLLWFPCPVEFTREELEYASIKELVETAPAAMLQCRGQLRFDYSPAQVAENHSCTHLHIGAENFRLPVQRPLEPCRFVRLVIRTAYPSAWDAVHGFRNAENWNAGDALSDQDRTYGNLAWNVMAAAAN